MTAGKKFPSDEVDDDRGTVRGRLRVARGGGRQFEDGHASLLHSGTKPLRAALEAISVDLWADRD
jgi:hypothetical protein